MAGLLVRKHFICNGTIVIFLLLVYSNCFAQKISLVELHNMSSNKNWETTNKYLLSKGWDYNRSEKGDDENYNSISWAYNKHGYEKEKAKAWMYVYTYAGLPNKVLYRFREKDFYTAIRQQLKISVYKLQDEEILDNRVIATYSNASFILEISYSRENDEDEYGESYTVYEVTVFKKGGIYDPNNGSKKEYDENGNIKSEYSLKEGVIHGLVKVFNPDGTIHKTLNIKADKRNGTSTEYIYRDSSKVLIGKYKGEYANDVRVGKWQTNIIIDDNETNLSYSNFINGVEEGEFRLVLSDSVIYGNYRNGLIDGKYTVFRDFKKMLIGGITNTDTLNLRKTSVGYYSENKKVGHWKNFDLSGVLTSEGLYSDDLKIGKWKFYYAKYEGNMNTADFSGQLYLEENYLNDKENGESIRYSYINKTEVPCKDKSEIPCYESKIIKILEKQIYKQGQPDGPYEQFDAAGDLTYKGQFVKGSQEGRWMLKNESEVIKWKGKTIEYGNFLNGERQGKWERYDNDNQLIEVYNYQNDVLDSEHILYKSNRPIEKRIFSKGMLTGLSILDNAENAVVQYELDGITRTNFKCIKTERAIDGIYKTSYSISKSPDEAISAFTFRIDFESLPASSKILDGQFRQITLDGKVIEEGTYKNNTKVGSWTNYYYDQKVKTIFEFDVYGNIQSEFYYDLKKEMPFSGEFVFRQKGSGIIEERKIKDGLRNGTTRIKDANDKTIKKISYKDGVIKE